MANDYEQTLLVVCDTCMTEAAKLTCQYIDIEVSEPSSIYCSGITSVSVSDGCKKNPVLSVKRRKVEDGYMYGDHEVSILADDGYLIEVIVNSPTIEVKEGVVTAIVPCRLADKVAAVIEWARDSKGW